ncbi:DUF7882 family protein [Microbacterium hydrocarbonoxydans]|uniref:DUF7882 family protein n=1 Tax=Microbacterium hydrocarbonoxydans TaxID=273678 RepID=UPI00203DCDB9|nr:hypothetical protein [Microbacterium hydrocarbonoxydans]MCM3778359.1 hypothetical protein [Microbacterium hydrocarbonoxydans]
MGDTMGHLTYGNSTLAIDVEDETLTHVRAVTLTKLRRNESFALTLHTPAGVETLWVQAAIPLRFVMEEESPIDRALLVKMMNAANSSGGLDLTRAEFAEVAAAPQLHAMSA